MKRVKYARDDKNVSRIFFAASREWLSKFESRHSEQKVIARDLDRKVSRDVRWNVFNGEFRVDSLDIFRVKRDIRPANARQMREDWRESRQIQGPSISTIDLLLLIRVEVWSADYEKIGVSELRVEAAPIEIGARNPKRGIVIVDLSQRMREPMRANDVSFAIVFHGRSKMLLRQQPLHCLWRWRATIKCE